MSFCSRVADNIRSFSLTPQTPSQAAAGLGALTALPFSLSGGAALCAGYCAYKLGPSLGGRLCTYWGKDEGAYALYLAGAERGNVQCIHEVAVSLLNGKGIDRNPEQAIDWLQKGVDQGSAKCMYELGRCYSKGIGVEKNNARAFELFQKGSDKGDTRCLRELGKCCQEGSGVAKDVNKAFALFQEGSKKGDTGCIYQLGLCYQDGEGVAKNLKKAFELFQQGSNQGDTGCMRQLGLCYQNGEGVAEDLKKAFDLFQEGSKRGDAHCMHQLGRCYLEGSGVAKDVSKALDLFQKAGEKGCIWVFSEVAMDFKYQDFYGYSSERVAFSWALKGAEKGDQYCMGWIAKEYYRGVAVRKDLRLAFYYFNQINRPVAWRIMQEFCEKGIGCERDLDLANEYREKLRPFQPLSLNQALAQL